MWKILWGIWDRRWRLFSPAGWAGHATNEDLFVGDPMRAATSRHVYLVVAREV
jgi:hypothetical protein